MKTAILVAGLLYRASMVCQTVPDDKLTVEQVLGCRELVKVCADIFDYSQSEDNYVISANKCADNNERNYWVKAVRQVQKEVKRREQK